MIRKWLVGGVWIFWVLLDQLTREETTVADGTPDGDNSGFYEAALTGAQRTYVLEVLKRAEHKAAGLHTECVRAIELARPTDLPPAHLDFDELEREADRQGCSPVDVLYDRAKAKEPGA